jgi:trehalose/maltose hydrolase-like predicted phosphorylase
LRYLHDIAHTDHDPNSAGGVRIAGLGGVWQAVVMGFGGLDLGSDVLGIDPKLPQEWSSLSFRVHWRGRVVAFRIAEGHAQATLVSGEPLHVRISDNAYTLDKTPLDIALGNGHALEPEPQREQAAPLH